MAQVLTVKSVVSGDTLVLRGRPVSGPPPEKLVSLSHISAPRLNLKEPAKEEVPASLSFATTNDGKVSTRKGLWF